MAQHVPSHRGRRYVAGLLFASLALVSCGSDDDGSSDQSSSTTVSQTDPTTPGSVAPSGEEVEIQAVDNTFRPEEIEIAAGTAVRWENGGRNDHNIVPVDDTADWGVAVADFAPGDVYERVFVTPGEYPYYCSLHGTADFGMIGTIVVTG